MANENDVLGSQVQGMRRAALAIILMLISLTIHQVVEEKKVELREEKMQAEIEKLASDVDHLRTKAP